MLSLIVSVGVSAEKLQMDFSNLNTGWGSNYEASTKTITFESAWQGRGWWFGSGASAFDASKYSQFVLEIEPTTFKVAVQVVYDYKKQDNSDESTYADVAAGGTKIVVNLNETMKNKIVQVYVQSDAAGSVVLKDAYFYREGPLFSSTKNAVSCEGIGTADATIDVSSLTTYPDNTVFAIVGTIDNLDHVGWGMGKVRDKSYGDLKSLGSWSSDETVVIMTVEELRSYAQDDDKIYIQIWNGTLKEVYVSLNTITIPLTSAGIGSMILPFAAEVPQGMKVYEAGTCENNTIHLNSVGAIKANTPYIIKGEAKDYVFVGVAEAQNFQYTVGNLCGTYEDITAPQGSYVLQKHGDEDAGFYPVNETQPTVRAYRAYLTSLPAGGSSCLRLVFDDETTSVLSVSAATPATYASYNLAGQRAHKGQKGIVIADGKKYIAK